LLKKNREKRIPNPNGEIKLEAKVNILIELYVKYIPIGITNPPEFTTTHFQVWAELIAQEGLNNGCNIK
jgi:hypothetical protein